MLTARTRVYEEAPAAPPKEGEGPQTLDLLHGAVLPTGRTVVVQPMKGRAERDFYRAVQSKDALSIHDAWDNLILFCAPVLDSQPNTADLVAEMDDADRRAIMLMQ